MKAETQKTVREILKRIVSSAVPVSWRATSPVPGGGERKSFSRGSSGYDVVARVEYEPGDDPRDIDWAATAQTGGQVVLTTQYQEPRDVKVFCLVDCNPTMDFGTARVNKRQLAAELAGSVIKSADETKDKVGFVAYSDHGIEFQLPPRSAQNVLMPSLVNLIEATGQKKGLESGLIGALALLPRQKSLVFIVSDFLHLSDAEKLAVRRAALTHDVVSLIIQDRRERELPAPTGWLPELLTVQDIRTGERRSIWLTKKNRQAFSDNFQHHHDTLLAFLKEAHCDRAVFSTEEGEAAIPKIMRLFSGHRG
ncbi:MAG TPA: DUF58 domain-containing protein [Planktothrix sp.]|jgi:uncharacterized protein (DUF58 family)